jgi:antitoxin FitA
MATLTIRKLDDRLKQRLRVRAAHNNRSMEEEARQILGNALRSSGKSNEPNLVESIRRKVEAVGGFDLKLPKREPIRTPPDFSE